MPKKCQEIFDILEIKPELKNNLNFGLISKNHVQKHSALFPRIDDND